MYQVVSERGLRINQKTMMELVEGELSTIASDCGDVGAYMSDQAKWLGYNRHEDKFIVATRFEFDSLSNHMRILTFDISVGTEELADAVAAGQGIDEDEDEAEERVLGELLIKKRSELDGLICLSNGERFRPEDRKDWVKIVVELVKEGT